MRNPAEWPANDVATLVASWRLGVPTRDIGARVGRSSAAVVGKARRLKLGPHPAPRGCRGPRPRKGWLDGPECFATIAALARLNERTISAVCLAAGVERTTLYGWKRGGAARPVKFSRLLHEASRAAVWRRLTQTTGEKHV